MKNYLKKHRVAAEMTQEEAALAAGVSQSTYQRWESGQKDVPKGKLSILSKSFSAPEDALLGLHPPILVTPYTPTTSNEVAHYGEIAFHFQGDGEPLVISVSVEEMNRVFRRMQEGSFYVLAESLANQKIAVRRSAISDVYVTSEFYDDSGPEQARYRVPPVLLPDPRDWSILADIAIDYADTEHPAYERLSSLVSMPDEEEVQAMVRRGVIDKDGIDDFLDAKRKAIAQIIELADKGCYQLSNGRRRRFDCEFEELHDNLYRVFRPFDDGLLRESEPQPHILIQDGGYSRSFFINPHAMDYISIPLHVWLDADASADDELMNS